MRVICENAHKCQMKKGICNHKEEHDDVSMCNMRCHHKEGVEDSLCISVKKAAKNGTKSNL